MKIALVTIHNANNYGAIFQAFALQQVLSRFGDVEIINYENRHISRSFDLVRFAPSIHGLLGMGKDFFRLLPRYIVIRKFKEFIDSDMKLTSKVTREDLARGELDSFDCYVAGSDQIWNPACVSGSATLDAVYFLDFAPTGAKKISYASSLGAYDFSDQEKLKLKEYLGDFSEISVRESGAQKLLQEVLGRNVSHVLDPTLLLSKDEWLENLRLSGNSQSNEKYILLYTVPKVPLVKAVVDFFSKKTGMKIVAIDQGLSAGARVDQHIRDAGPLDFIRLFSEAEFVITDSFHGVCFSLNFDRPFVAISPGKYSNRVESLLSLVGLESRLISGEEDLLNYEMYVDCAVAQQELQAARRASLDFLSSSIES